MKSFCKLLVACGLAAGAVSGAAAAPSAAADAISISELSPDRFELIYSGTKFASRDEVEKQLLLSSARLALAHGKRAFVLLALPGEQRDVHPPRPNPAFGGRYGHWQPHWNYYIPQYGWQWWHPEWGADFWTRDVDPAGVQRFEVHAMIDLDEAAGTQPDAPAFDANAVVRDLTRAPNVGAEHAHP